MFKQIDGAAMEEHLLFRIGRWQHSRTKQAGVYP
jgi:hypothetical protein